MRILIKIIFKLLKFFIPEFHCKVLKTITIFSLERKFSMMPSKKFPWRSKTRCWLNAFLGLSHWHPCSWSASEIPFLYDKKWEIRHNQNIWEIHYKHHEPPYLNVPKWPDTDPRWPPENNLLFLGFRLEVEKYRKCFEYFDWSIAKN